MAPYTMVDCVLLTVSHVRYPDKIEIELSYFSTKTFIVAT